MRHRILTCKNHPDLRWSCKDIAWGESGYNGSRSLFFIGTPSGKGMHFDGSGLDCTTILNGQIVQECDCPSAELVLAPEDELVVR
jgi:hypothetical protein